MPTKKATDDAGVDTGAAPDTPADDAPVDEGAIRKVVAEMLESLGITSDDTPDDDAPKDAKPAGARTQAAVEADVETQVRAEIAKLRGEEDRDRRLNALEEKTAAEQERSPVKARVSTRLMGWGRKGQ